MDTVSRKYIIYLRKIFLFITLINIYLLQYRNQCEGTCKGIVEVLKGQTTSNVVYQGKEQNGDIHFTQFKATLTLLYD